MTTAFTEPRPADDAVVARVDGLAQAASAALGHLDEQAVIAAQLVVEQARVRVRLSSRYTVVGLAGATGSGKSTLFNKLCGLDLAAVGVKRPTTSWALSCSWSDGAEALLEWLGVPPRHQVSRGSSLDTARARSHDDEQLSGLVLLDLPDHDSTEVSHHLEVERLVGLADLVFWVLDPQKYADAAIHDRFLRPLASHREVMAVVFNHVDEIDASERERTLADVRRVLDRDGLDRIPLLVTSALTGEGMDALRDLVASRVSEKSAAVERITADVRRAAHRLAASAGADGAVGLGEAERATLVAAAGEASGADSLLQRHEDVLRERARLSTRWLSLRRASVSPRDVRPTVDEPALAGAVRVAADAASTPLPRAWRDAVRGAAPARVPELGRRLRDELDAAGQDLGRPPGWWTAQRVLQWVFALVGLAGLGLLVSQAVRGEPTPQGHLLGLPLGSWLLVAGVALSLVVSLVARAVAIRSVRGLRARAGVTVTRVVTDAVDASVLTPLDADLDGFRRFRAGITVALDG